MGLVHYLEILVPLSLFLMIGYHVNLWYNFKYRPSHTSIGIDSLRRKEWFLDLKEALQGNDKKGMLAVQSSRNALMGTILNSTIAILINLALAALTNNTFNASHLFNSVFFGSQSGRIFILKYGSASLFLLVSFLCSSMAIGFLIDANFLINASGDHQFSSVAYTQTVLERGFMLGFIGNRVLCMTFPLLLWMFGPLPMALSSVALVWGLYELDFVAGKYETIV